MVSMVRVSPKKLDEEIAKQEETYGDRDEEFSSATNPDVVGKDTEEDLKRVIGNFPEEQEDEEEEGFSMAKEVEEDEKDEEEGEVA